MRGLWVLIHRPCESKSGAFPIVQLWIFLIVYKFLIYNSIHIFFWLKFEQKRKEEKKQRSEKRKRKEPLNFGCVAKP